MRSKTVAGMIALPVFAIVARSAPAEGPDDPVGRWLTANSSGVIEIERCGATALCGRIVGINRDNGTDPQPIDAHGQPQCGLTIITNAVPSGHSEWTGRINNPIDGRSYGAQISVDAYGRLHLRGYLGLPIFGETVVWQPFAGRIGDGCRVIG